MNTVTITKTDLEDRLRNKEELVYFFEFIGQYYLPPDSYVSNHYLGQLLSGEKKLLRLNEMASTWVPPHTPFLRVRDMFDDIVGKMPDF